ncbi:hypothetical protein ROR02_26420 [Pararhodospirillum oryzae]|uniref:Uncharacterized protein n=1 Tax=Pararhodospirillum oryzae TaxID=478448 RepID=A0A512HAM8_9PROT|nr:hypothetical protein ROR02_26420 [Pararhodospirillum oryzae]
MKKGEREGGGRASLSRRPGAGAPRRGLPGIVVPSCASRFTQAKDREEPGGEGGSRASFRVGCAPVAVSGSAGRAR